MRGQAGYYVAIADFYWDAEIGQNLSQFDQTVLHCFHIFKRLYVFGAVFSGHTDLAFQNQRAGLPPLPSIVCQACIYEIIDNLARA